MVIYMHKKLNKIFIMLLLLIFPLNILAYSEYIIPGGENLGIEINSDGIIIIGFYKVNGQYNWGTPSLKVGDRIIKVNDIETNDIDTLIKTIDETITDNKVKLTIKRKNSIENITLSLTKINGIYKTGLYVKDNLTGIGTLTYIDPETLIYGALGHEVIESNINERIEVKTGLIFKSMITGITRSVNGSPGGKNAKFYYNVKYGNIIKNTPYGIFGTYNNDLPDTDLIEVGKPDEIKTGKAVIKTVLSRYKIEEYVINITNIDYNAAIKNLTFKITDQKLLNKAGGIVQGMSGSPIIQNNKIIGAVTHVIVDNVESGYGIFITTMLEEGENN